VRSTVRRYLPLAVALVSVLVAAAALAVGWHYHERNRHQQAAGNPRTHSGFPDGSDTGVPPGTRLTRVPADRTSGDGWAWNKYGWVQVTAANARLSGLDIDGSLHSTVSGVTITDTRIRCTGENDWCLSIGSHTTVTDTEIGGQSDGHSFGKAAGVLSVGSDAGNLLQRLNVHNTSDGLRLDGGTRLADSWVHDLIMGDPADPGAHSDGVQSTGGGNVVIEGNRFETGNNCNVFVQWLAGQPPVTEYTVTGNYFGSGNRNGQQTSYGVCIYGSNVDGPVTVTGNVFSRGWQVGAATVPPAAVVSGNRYADGAPVTPVSR